MLSVAIVAGAGLGYPATVVEAQFGGLASAYVLGVVLAAVVGGHARSVGVGSTTLLTSVSWTVGARWQPLIDLRLAASPGLAVLNVVAMVTGMGVYSLLTLAVVVVRSDETGFRFH